MSGFYAAMYAVMFLIPAAALVWFIVALVLFLRTPKEDGEKRKSRLTLVLIPAVILALTVLVILFLAGMFTMSIVFM